MFRTTESLKELMSFLCLVNYFRNHTTHPHHLYNMVSAANKQVAKPVIWTSDGKTELKTLKNLTDFQVSESIL